MPEFASGPPSWQRALAAGGLQPLRLDPRPLHRVVRTAIGVSFGSRIRSAHELMRRLFDATATGGALATDAEPAPA